MGTELVGEFSKDETQVAEKHFKMLNTLAIRDMQIKTILRFHLTQVIKTNINKTNDSKCW